MSSPVIIGADFRAAPVGSPRTGAVGEAVAAARAAQREWGESPVPVRLACVRRLRRLVAANAERLARAVCSSRGNPLAEALAGEVLPLADACRFLEREAARLLRPRPLGRRGRPAWLGGVGADVRREPFGVVLVVGPGNYPLFLPGVQAVQALVAGNAVLVKPGAGGTPAAAAFVGHCRDAGFDPNLVRLLPESPTAAADAIEAGVDKVVLTGSAETGESVLGRIAPKLVPATLELSGCDAAFVRADADLDLAARAFRFALVWNGGATCVAPRRVFVPRESAAALETKLRDALGAVPRDPVRWQLGPEARASVRGAVERGARPVTGFGAGGAWADLPTVLADASPAMPLLRDGVFAPVLALVPVAGDDEALEAAGQSPYALGATVFGAPGPARAFAARVRAGVVVVNDVIVPTADPRVPFGGRGRSGFGVTRGAEGLLEMTTVKVVAVRRSATRRHLDPPVFTDHELVLRYIEAAHGATWGGRVAAGWGLVERLARLVWTGAGGNAR